MTRHYLTALSMVNIKSEENGCWQGCKLKESLFTVMGMEISIHNGKHHEELYRNLKNKWSYHIIQNCYVYGYSTYIQKK